VAFDCSCGSTFLLGGHLLIIVCEPFGTPESVITVPLTSKKSNSDMTVTLSPGDHDFIIQDTVIGYGFARIFETEDIKRRILEKDFEPHDKFDDDLIKVIQRGLIESPHTPRDIKRTFIESHET